MKNKKIITGILLSVFSFNLVSCEIPFEKILDQQDEIVKEVKVEGIDLDKDSSIEEYNEYQEKINSIFKVIGNQDFYLKNFNNFNKFYTDIMDNFTLDYIDSIRDNKDKNILKKVMDNIYYNENTLFKESKIIGMGRKNDTTKLEVEVIAVNDTLNFMIQTIDIYINNDGKINNIEYISSNSSIENTTKGLDDNSYLEKDNKSFLSTLSEFLIPFKNKELYKLSQNNNQKQKFDYELNTLIENLKLKNQDNNVLISLFKAGKGTFDNYGIIGYMHYDKNAEPISVYTIEFSQNGKLVDYDFYYNRLSKTIYRVQL